MLAKACRHNFKLRNILFLNIELYLKTISYIDVLKTLNWVYLHDSAFLKAIIKFWRMAVIQFIVWKVNKIQGGVKLVYYFSI